MASGDEWPDMAAELRRVLADGLDVSGTIDETEILTHVGSASLEIVIEASDLDGDDQAFAYLDLCDILATRLSDGCSQVVGCLLFATEPDAASLASGLLGMQRETGVFTPVLPLARSQAQDLADAGISIDQLMDDSAALIEIAANRHPITVSTAETLLAELDELIDRRT
jgi:hypothetical protein